MIFYKLDSFTWCVVGKGHLKASLSDRFMSNDHVVDRVWEAFNVDCPPLGQCVKARVFVIRFSIE